MCPGRNLVLLTTTTFLAVLLTSNLDLRLTQPGDLGSGNLPGTLSPYHLRFTAN